MSPSNAALVANSLRSTGERLEEIAVRGAEAAAEEIHDELRDSTLDGGVVRSVSGNLKKSFRIRTRTNGHHAELYSRAPHALSINFGSHRVVRVSRGREPFAMRMNVRRTMFLSKALTARRKRAADRAFDLMRSEMR